MLPWIQIRILTTHVQFDCRPISVTSQVQYYRIDITVDKLIHKHFGLKKKKFHLVLQGPSGFFFVLFGYAEGETTTANFLCFSQSWKHSPQNMKILIFWILIFWKTQRHWRDINFVLHSERLASLIHWFINSLYMPTTKAILSDRKQLHCFTISVFRGSHGKNKITEKYFV